MLLERVFALESEHDVCESTFSIEAVDDGFDFSYGNFWHDIPGDTSSFGYGFHMPKTMEALFFTTQDQIWGWDELEPFIAEADIETCVGLIESGLPFLDSAWIRMWGSQFSYETRESSYDTNWTITWDPASGFIYQLPNFDPNLPGRFVKHSMHPYDNHYLLKHLGLSSVSSVFAALIRDDLVVPLGAHDEVTSTRTAIVDYILRNS